MADRGILSSLSAAAWRLLGPPPQVQAQQQVFAPPVPASATTTVARTDAADAARADCLGGGCGPAPGWGGNSEYGPLGWQYIGLDLLTIDRLLREQLMYTIVSALVDDACQDRPTLAGETCGELTDCVGWNAERGYYEAEQQALFYSRAYGGGGAVCVVDDGRAPWEEVDPLVVRDVCGYFALPKWYIVPADAGSPRVRAGWYGQRLGRPEHYWVTPVVSPDYEEARLSGSHDVMREVMHGAGGQRFHRSRVIAWPYRTDLDLRQARQFAGDAGWGPGVVEGCAAAYMARRTGALRVDTIMASSHFNVFSTPNVATALSTPEGGVGIRNIIRWVVDCLAETEGGTLPFTTIDKASTLEPKSHTLTGIPQILAEQRKFLLDNLPEYCEARIFAGGGGGAGISGDSKQDGQWRTYYGNVETYRRTVVWTAGKHGGGQRQAHCLAMMSRTGPTDGQLDLTIEPTWPNLWQESGEATARTRKLNAEARALDRTTLGLTPAAMLRHDKTLAGSASSTYASLEVDDGPLPEVASESLPGNATPNALEAPSATPGITPAAAVSDLNEPKTDEATGIVMGPDLDPVAPTTTTPATQTAADKAMALQGDTVTEVAMAQALGMTRATFRKWAVEHNVEVFPVAKGTRGGNRYSGSKVLAAWQASAKARLDAAMAQS